MKIISCLLISFYFCFALAQGFGSNKNTPIVNTDPLEIVKTELNPEDIEVGGATELKIIMKLPPEFHAYLDQFKVEVKSPKDVYFSEVQVTPVVDFKDPVTKKIKKGTQGTSELITVITVPSSIRSGKKNVKGILTYQACTKDYCLFPKKLDFDFPMKVTGSSPQKSFIEESLDKGIFVALLIIFFSGILTSFTPCIFPLIPITLAVIGTTETKGSKLRGFIVSLTYVLGIAVTYSILGLIAAKTGAMFGSLLGSPLVVSIIALLFVAMAMSMFGLYEVKIPDKITTKLMGKSWEKGLLGAFMSGLIAGVVASPCVGPVLVSILTFVAQGQNTAQGVLFLFVFALGLGQIFLVLGTFSQLAYKLPKSGPWLESIKFIFGLMMIGAALYFVAPVTSDFTFNIILSATLILLGIFFGAFKKTNITGHNSPLIRITMRLLLLLGIMFGVKASLPDHFSNSFFGDSIGPSYAKPDWYPYSDGALKKAIEEKRPVIIDFQAEWCLACKELEIKTFSKDRVLQISEEKNILWLAFDATNDSEELNILREKYTIQGLPMVVFYDSTGEWREDLTLTGFEEADRFIERLDEL